MRILSWLPVGLILSAWSMFLVSFFLPATNTLVSANAESGSPLTGWEAFYTSFLVLISTPFIVLIEPRTLLFLMFPIVNFVMALAPWIAASEDRAVLLGLFLVPCGFLPWLLPRGITGDILIGFYLWNASYFLMAVGCILRRYSIDSCRSLELR